MSVKLHLDTDRFLILCSLKASLNIPVSVSPLGKAEPRNTVLQCLNGGGGRGIKIYTRVCNRSLDSEDGIAKLKSEKNPDTHVEYDGKTIIKKDFLLNVDAVNANGSAAFQHKQVLDRNLDDGGIVERGIAGKYKGVYVKGWVGEVQGKHSKRWVAKEHGLSKQKWEREQRRGTKDEGRVVKKKDIGPKYWGSIAAILLALDTVKDLDEALRPWEETLNNKERSVILKEQTGWERALEIFEWFKKKGCYELNVIHYNIMLRILGRAKKWHHVESLWDEMKARGVIPIDSTYGTLIDVYCKGGHKEGALLWLERMNRHGLEPDEVTVGNVVQLYKKYKEFHKAEEFFKKWSSVKEDTTKEKGSFQYNARRGSHMYNTLIDTYGKAGKLEEVSNTFEQMLREGVAPTTVTFNTIIHICGNHGRLDEVTSLMQKMEECRCPPDTRTYNILMALHVKHDDINMAMGYFRKMKEAGLEPNLVSYRTLLCAYSVRQMVGEAEDLVAEMDDRGRQIDEFSQAALIRMYIGAGRLEQSWEWFRRFHLAGNMSSECYSANIDAYGESGHILEAEKVFACCQEVGKLSVLVYNVMVKAYGIGKEFDKACQLFDSMENEGVTPDQCSYRTLMQILLGADLPHMAAPYLRQMQEARLVTDSVP